jgi:hypothetical protein
LGQAKKGFFETYSSNLGHPRIRLLLFVVSIVVAAAVLAAFATLDAYDS